MTDAIWQIERKRRQLKLSASQLSALAGINPNHYSTLVARKANPKASTIANLRLALARHARGGAALPPFLIYRLCLLYVCQAENANLVAVLAQDPTRRATQDPDWMRAAEIRGKALYIAHNYCSVPQKQLAEVVGISTAAVSQAMGRVEDGFEVDDHPLFQTIETAIGGS